MDYVSSIVEIMTTWLYYCKLYVVSLWFNFSSTLSYTSWNVLFIFTKALHIIDSFVFSGVESWSNICSLNVSFCSKVNCRIHVAFIYSLQVSAIINFLIHLLFLKNYLILQWSTQFFREVRSHHVFVYNHL